MESAAYNYAAELRERGYLDVAVFRYDTPLDNRDPFRRDHRTAFGWAVRYTSSPETDAEVWKGSYGEQRGLPAPKFHDRSLTVFTLDNEFVSCDPWLRQRSLTDRGGVLADFAGEGTVPMYVSHWSPSVHTPGVRPENIPAVPYVGLKRFPVRENSSSYPWQIGPHRFYHMIMTPA
jgi:hypothetical protein